MLYAGIDVVTVITVVVLMCHQLANIPAPVCREEIAVKEEMSMLECQVLSQPKLADWKEKSIFSGDQWVISRYRCVIGDYILRDAI